MKPSRKLIAFALASIMALSLLAGCANNNSPSNPDPSDSSGQTSIQNQPQDPAPQIPDGALVIADQGVFAAGGVVLESDGTFDPVNGQYDPTGQTHHADHASVFYQIPADANGHAMMFLHGYGQSRTGWMTTPDGRDGWNDIFLRKGYSTYLVDQPRRGDAGQTSVPQEISAVTQDQAWFTQFRLGRWPEFNEGSQFPQDEASIDQFFRQMTPDTGAFDQTVIADALVAAFEQSGPGILVTHSQGGMPGWEIGAKSDKVEAVVAIEPGSVPFPASMNPDEIAYGYQVSDEEFAALIGLFAFSRYMQGLMGGPVTQTYEHEHHQIADGGSIVYMTTDISPEGLMSVYEALEWTPNGKVAVKLSTGEPPASNYLDPNLIKELVQMVNGTIVENNTAYGGSRSETAMHYQVAKDHGFTDIADVVILDENGSMSLPVTGGTRLTENLVGEHFGEYDSYLVLSHFKGHAMAGFGGAIKNISIGLGSKEGKCLIHTAGTSHDSPWGGEQNAFLDSMAEAGKSVSDYLNSGESIVYISVMNRLSVDCDCDGNPAEPDMHDIGILASTDPVALDQACVDLVYAAEDGASLIARMESRNAERVLEHGAEIGLGSREYQLVNLDD